MLPHCTLQFTRGRYMVYKLAVLNSHPIQYFVPLYRRLALEPDVELTVYFCSLQGAEAYVDQGFGSTVKWDVSLLDGYRWKLLPSARKPRAVGGFWSVLNPSVVRELVRNRYDAVLIHGHGHATYLLALVAARALGVPVLMRCDTHLGLRRSAGRRLVRKVVMRLLYRGLCSACLPIGDRNRAFYRSLGVSDDRMVTAPYSVDNSLFTAADDAGARRGASRDELGIGRQDVLLLYSSKMSAGKRPLDLLRAYEAIGSVRSRIALAFVGTGVEEATLRAYVRTHSLDNVHFLGFHNQSELGRLYAMADVFVLPAENEAWGLVINEAMAAGLPIVASEEIGAVPDLVHHGHNGLLFPAGDVAALTACLKQLVDDPDLRLRMGRRSREIIETWGIDQTANGILKALHLVNVGSLEADEVIGPFVSGGDVQ